MIRRLINKVKQQLGRIGRARSAEPVRNEHAPTAHHGSSPRRAESAAHPLRHEAAATTEPGTPRRRRSRRGGRGRRRPADGAAPPTAASSNSPAREGSVPRQVSQDGGREDNHAARRPARRPARQDGGREDGHEARRPARQDGGREDGHEARRPARHDEPQQRSAPHHARPAASAEPTPPAPPWHREEYVVPSCEGRTRFQDLDLPDEILHAVADLGFQYCTPIQAAILPATLEGKDTAGKAQTGTGKTAAFLIAALTRFLRAPRKNPVPGTPRALVLAPTRELAVQIHKDAVDLAKYTGHACTTIFGGMDYRKQQAALTDEHVDIVAGTPGRIIDFIRNRVLDLSKVEILIIDEADRMLDMGFIPDVRRIINTVGRERQTLLFSATLTPAIMRLSAQWTKNPVLIEIEPEHVTLDTTDQIAYIIKRREKFSLIYNLITKKNLTCVMVFCNRRDETRRLTDELKARGISCALLSGDVSQSARFTTLEKFRAGEIRALIATDVAARGIHVDGVSHVINYNLPDDPEMYVHRIGRTGRAGATGISISFASEDDAHEFPALQAFIGKELRCEYPTPDLLEPPPHPTHRVERHESSGGYGGGGGRRPPARRRY